MTNNFPAQKGFTLIETLVAVLLLATAIAGPLTIASKGLNSALTSKDQIAAFYLAQDAMEYVRFKRDSNKLAGNSWLTNMAGSGLCSSDGNTPCRVDSIQDTVVACTGSPVVCPILNYDTTNKYFTYADVSSSVVETPQRFIRTVQVLTPVGSNNSEAKITVTVSWRGVGNITRTITIRENLYDWQ